MDEGEFYIQKWIIEHTKLSAENYHRYSKLFEIRKAGQAMDDDIKQLDELIAAMTDNGARLGERGFEPVDPCEYVIVVELAQGGAVVHHPIMKRVNTLDSLETLAQNLMECTRGAIKASVCRVVREQYLEEDYI